jgi:polar amino acid transport system permease protein
MPYPEEREVLNSTPRLIGHPLSAVERREWRLVTLLLGAALIFVSFVLPMFPQRIISAQTTFSGGTARWLSFPTLVSGQHMALASRPLNEELAGLEIVVRPTEQHGGSGYAWLAEVATTRRTLGQFVSFFVCLLTPLLAAAFAMATVLSAWHSKVGLREWLVPWAIRLAALGVGALLLAWLHQIDFSARLLSLDPVGLSPGIGFWGSLIGAVLMFTGAMALRHETHRAISNWWVLVVVVALMVWLLTRAKPYPYLEIWDFVSDGIVVTLRIVTTSFGLILLVSLLGGLGRISSSKIIYGISSLYVELVRGIPLLVQLLFIWFALPQLFDVAGAALIEVSPALLGAGRFLIDLRLSAFTAAVVGLTVCYGAYGSEIFRAGISSIHHGQMEAARSLGMTYVQAMRHIVLPQAVRVILPPIGNEFVALLKDSSLVSVLAVSDLTRRGREYMARTFLSFDTWIMVALCYLVLTLFSSRAVEFIESKSRFER